MDLSSLRGGAGAPIAPPPPYGPVTHFLSLPTRPLHSQPVASWLGPSNRDQALPAGSCSQATFKRDLNVMLPRSQNTTCIRKYNQVVEMSVYQRNALELVPVSFAVSRFHKCLSDFAFFNSFYHEHCSLGLNFGHSRDWSR